MRILPLALVLLLLVPTTVFGQDRILLQEVLPALEGSELGLLELGDAPPPGSTRVVRRSEIRRALARADRSSRGLSIPRSTRVRRQAQTLDEDALTLMASEALAEVLSPCAIGELMVPREVRISSGRMHVRAEARAPRRSGNVGAVLIVEAGGRETRVPVRAAVECPPPAVQPGSRVRIQVVIGNVRASAPGEARQDGRVGDVIRVTNGVTRATLRARIIDPQTVELVQ